MSNIKKIFVELAVFLFIVVSAFFIIRKFFYRQKTVNILSWVGTFDHNVISRFENETGIKVNLLSYSTNEELISKLLFSGGKGIDLIVPSDYVLDVLRSNELIAPIDRLKVKNLSLLYLKLVTDAIYKGKLYGIPIEWNIYGLAANKKASNAFKSTRELCQSFFSGNGIVDSMGLKICMTNDPLTAINLVVRYYEEFFHNKIADNSALFTIIYEILKKQKRNVRIYSDMKIAYLFKTEAVDISCVHTCEYLMSLKDNPNLKFYFFPFGIVKSVEYMSILKNAVNVSEAYEFMNYILRPLSMIANHETSFSLPVSDAVIDDLQYSEELKEIVEEALFSKNRSFRITEFLDETERLRLWMMLKVL
jgi:spermidine/putrescine transport system substrate-binding protein